MIYCFIAIYGIIVGLLIGGLFGFVLGIYKGMKLSELKGENNETNN